MNVPDEKKLEQFTKTVAIAAVFVYACGYIVITIRNANYGFSAGEVLKPRIIAAGVTFAVLCIVPMCLAHVTILRGTSKDAIARAKKALSILTYEIEIITFILLKSAFIHADPISTAPIHFRLSDWLQLAATLLLYGFIIFVSTYGRYYVEGRPNLIFSASLLSVALGIGMQFLHSDHADAAANLWLFFSGLIACWAYRTFVAGNLSLSYLSILVPALLVGMNFYASFVFPHIYQRWGGGYPTEIALVITEKSSNKPSDFAIARLIDEDSSGIFVQYRSSEVAVFIPKEAVSRICYLDRTQPNSVGEILFPSLISYELRPDNTVGCVP